MTTCEEGDLESSNMTAMSVIMLAVVIRGQKQMISYSTILPHLIMRSEDL